MRRLLQNLISNAIKYTPSGGVLVGCRKRRGKFFIEVHDSGIGIPHNRQKHVFQEFRRLDQGAMIARGLGLGLSIVERMARVMEHRVGLVSRPGKGSVFSLEVPLAAPSIQLPSLPGVVVASTALTGLRVLCIDNEPAILEGMRLLLGGWGCHVITAPDHRKALTQLKATTLQPDALIADYHLDHADGLLAIKAIRKSLRIPLRAILLTADRSAELRAQAEAIGVHVFNKPLKPAALRAWLSQIGVSRHAAE